MTDIQRRTIETIIQNRAQDGDLYSITIFANERVPRSPIQLVLDGLSTRNYERNPIVLWAHDAVGRTPSGGIPIGRTNKLHKDDDKLRAEFEFLTGDPFVDRVRNAWDRGFINAASVSWAVEEYEEVPKEEGGGYRDTKTDLLEWSLVPVPADPDALRRSHDMLIREFVEATPTNDNGNRTRDLPAEEYLEQIARRVLDRQLAEREAVRRLVELSTALKRTIQEAMA